MDHNRRRVIVITGNGKGKTTASLGMAWTALGRGWKVMMIQFMKSPESSGEHFAALAYEGRMTINPLGRKGFMTSKTGKPVDQLMAEYALREARVALTSGLYDLVILDEANVAVLMNLIALEELVGLIRDKPDNVELILTGRGAHPDVVALADVVSEFVLVKHYYDQGVLSRQGIEY